MYFWCDFRVLYACALYFCVTFGFGWRLRCISGVTIALVDVFVVFLVCRSSLVGVCVVFFFCCDDTKAMK